MLQCINLYSLLLFYYYLDFLLFLFYLINLFLCFIFLIINYLMLGKEMNGNDKVQKCFYVEGAVFSSLPGLAGYKKIIR